MSGPGGIPFSPRDTRYEYEFKTVYVSQLIVIGIHISFSPNACVAVMLDSEGQIQLRLMEHSYGAENGLYDEGRFNHSSDTVVLDLIQPYRQILCRHCSTYAGILSGLWKRYQYG